MKKNEEYIGVVTALGSNGEGIIKDNGLITFIPYAIEGEKVRYKILKVNKNIAFGKLLEVITPSQDRIAPICPVFNRCGGCQIQHINYKKQLEIKRQTVEDCFRKIAFSNVSVNMAIACEKEFGYRNKLQLPVAFNGNETVIGFYAENTHRVVPIDDCPINPKWTKNIICAFKQYITEFAVKGYDGERHAGELREITAKEIQGNLIITAVFLDKNIRGKDRLVEILKSRLSENFSLYFNINGSRSNVIYGEEFILYYGASDYIANVDGIKCKFGVQSFMQVNDEMRSKLYQKVKENLKADENTTVIDAYSGAGLMTALLSKTANKAIGIEIVSEAVDCANDLAKLNGLENKITNHNGACEHLLPSIIEKEKKAGSNIAVVLDPPRKGCDLAVINAVKDSGADRIVYVSCLPSSLARDVGLLIGTLEHEDGKIIKAENVDGKYQIESVTPLDMFPQTKHVETLCVLSRKGDIYEK